jgi:hypothetical protein
MSGIGCGSVLCGWDKCVGNFHWQASLAALGTFTTGKRGTFLDIVIFIDTEEYNYDIFLITVTKEYILT